MKCCILDIIYLSDRIIGSESLNHRFKNAEFTSNHSIEDPLLLNDALVAVVVVFCEETRRRATHNTRGAAHLAVHPDTPKESDLLYVNGINRPPLCRISI